MRTLVALASTIVVVACGGNKKAGNAVPPAGAKMAAVSGTVFYRERMALPPGAALTVQLADVSKADAPADVIATETKMLTTQVPVPFSLSYDPTDDPAAAYVRRPGAHRGGRQAALHQHHVQSRHHERQADHGGHPRLTGAVTRRILVLLCLLAAPAAAQVPVRVACAGSPVRCRPSTPPSSCPISRRSPMTRWRVDRSGRRAVPVRAAFVQARFRAIGLDTLSTGMLERFPAPAGSPGKAANVMGSCRGGSRPGRIILVTAHYDHLGARKGVVYNGADDNASGTAALLAMAAWFRLHPPENTADVRCPRWRGGRPARRCGVRQGPSGQPGLDPHRHQPRHGEPEHEAAAVRGGAETLPDARARTWRGRRAVRRWR